MENLKQGMINLLISSLKYKFHRNDRKISTFQIIINNIEEKDEF